jgi:hypothetical protein
MTDNTSLVNIGELSKPATVLIEKISEAIGGIARPSQIRRVAKAEAEAEVILAKARIKSTGLEKRAMQRFKTEEVIKQRNIESITAKALPDLKEDAQPQNMEADWISNFFDKSRLISNQEMQVLWGRVLSGEANSPGTYSKRTVNFLGSLDITDALLFQSLCRFNWNIGVERTVILDPESEIYQKYGINFSSLLHLDEIGLLSFDPLAGYLMDELPKIFTILYFGRPLIIEFNKEEENEFPIGKVLLSKVGKELAPICGAEPVPDFFDYFLNECRTNMGLKILFPTVQEQDQSNNTPSESSPS